jgi:hypothetical protein
MRTWILFALFALSACSGPARPSVSPDEAQRLLLNRNWLDQLPEDEHTRLHVYRFVPRMGGGVYQDRTLFAGKFELFTFEHTGEEIRFHLPHTKERRTVAYRITALQPGEAPPFDLRLQFDRSPRGPATYYSVRADSAASAEALDEGLRRLLGRLGR